MTFISSKTWDWGGVEWSHSIILNIFILNITIFFVVKDSQRIYKKNIVETKEIKEPKEETIFHEVYISG